MILPKKIDAQKAKILERKMQIDEGIVLSKRIDDLRQMRLEMEKNFETWRVNTSTEVQKEINNLIELKEDLEKQVNKAQIQRNALLEPLDKEIAELEQQKIIINQEKNNLFLDKERLAKETLDLQKDKSFLASKNKLLMESKKEIEKNVKESIKLKQLAKDKYAEILNLDVNRKKIHEDKMNEVYNLFKEYEVGLKTIEIREKQVDEKELELLEKETLLKDRMATFERNLTRTQNGK